MQLQYLPVSRLAQVGQPNILQFCFTSSVQLATANDRLIHGAPRALNAADTGQIRVSVATPKIAQGT